MARPIRDTDPSKIRLITIRTEGARLFLRPDTELNNLVGGILARYQEEFDIKIFAYAVLSNHYHLLIQAPLGNAWRYAQAVNREIAKRVNGLRNRSGHFWQRRYSEQIVLEDTDALEGLLYITTNCVHHGLVEHPTLWPGLSSYNQCLDGADREFSFTNHTELSKANGDQTLSIDYVTKHSLRLSPLPHIAHLPGKERAKLLRSLIERKTRQLVRTRRKLGKGFIGRDMVLKQSCFSLPREIKRTIRPICYTRNFLAKKRFLEEYLPRLADYLDASRRFRNGEKDVEFPAFTILPPLHYSVLSNLRIKS